MSTSEASDQNYVATKHSEGATSLQSSCPQQNTSELKRNVDKECEETVTMKVSEDVQSIQEKHQEVSTPVNTNIHTSKTIPRSSGSTSSLAPKPDTIEEKLKMRRKVSDKDVDLLMIGKTGNGKSALGNAILRRDIFESSGSTNSVTFNVDYDSAEFEDRTITVVDVPGIAETRLSSEKSTNHIMKSMEYAIKINPEGYHAFLLVVKYGNRLTDEETNAIKFLRTIFGEDFVKKFCIIIMTGGDNFERDNRKKNITFLEWCEKEKGEFQELLKECSRRIILFDSVTEKEDKQYKQVAQLLKTVDNLASSGKRYSDANFEAAKMARDKLMIESKEPMIRKETMRETSLILDKLSKIINYKDLNETMITLNELLDRATALYKSTKEKDKGTGALHQLLLTINDIINQVKKEIKHVNTKAKDIEQNKERERKHNFEMQKIKEEADRKIKEEQIALEKANKENEEKRKKFEEDMKKHQEEQRRKEVEFKKELAEAKRKEDEWKKELAEAKTKEEEIEKDRLINEEKQRKQIIAMQKLKEEAERKIKEEKIALEKANKENEKERKKFEEDLKKRQEEQRRKEEEFQKELAEAKRKEDELEKELAEAKRKEEEIEKDRLINEEKQRKQIIAMQKLKEEAERKIIEEKIALEKSNKENEEERKKFEEDFKKRQEEQRRKEEELKKELAEAKRKEDELKKESAEAKRKEEEIEKIRLMNEERQRNQNIAMQKLKEEAERKIEEEKIALEKAKKENEEKRKKIEEDLKKRQEEQRRKEEELKQELLETKRKEGELKKELADAKRKEEEIIKNRLINAEKQKQDKINMEKMQVEAERKINEEKIAMAMANKEKDDMRIKLEEDLKKQKEEQNEREEKWKKEQADEKIKLDEELKQEKARTQREIETLIKTYKDVKSNSDEGLLTALGEMIKLSAGTVGEFLKECVEYIMQNITKKTSN